jgi:outer membrane protein assembly factor BamB
MSCALTQGYALDCRDNVGGIKEIYITELPHITSPTITAGTVTAITMQTGSQFWKYQLEKETATLVEHIQTNDANGTVHYEHALDFSIRKLQANWRNEIRLLAQNRLAIIVLDRNGKYWLCGMSNGMELQNADTSTGKGMGDFNGYQLKFKGKEEQPMPQVILSDFTVLLSPAA